MAPYDCLLGSQVFAKNTQKRDLPSLWKTSCSVVRFVGCLPSICDWSKLPLIQSWALKKSVPFPPRIVQLANSVVSGASLESHKVSPVFVLTALRQLPRTISSPNEIIQNRFERFFRINSCFECWEAFSSNFTQDYNALFAFVHISCNDKRIEIHKTFLVLLCLKLAERVLECKAASYSKRWFKQLLWKLRR